MLLIDLMEKYNGGAPFCVFCDGELLALADGREEIPKDLNEREVASVFPYGDGVGVAII